MARPDRRAFCIYPQKTSIFPDFSAFFAALAFDLFSARGLDFAPHSLSVHLASQGARPVNKNDLIAAVAEAAELSKADATRAVDAVIDTITGQLKDGGEVRIVGFGTFATSQRAATTGRNPRTGESIDIPASVQPKFKAGKALKDAVN